MGGQPSGTVTFLFTDIEGSTVAWDRFGPAMTVAQERHDRIVRDWIDRYAGYVFSTGGDGVAVAFADAGGAVSCALGIQRALASEAWPDGLSIRVRMGMHTGTAIERDGDYFGPDVIRAARLMSLVDGRRVVCSRRTLEAARGQLSADYEVVDLGIAKLKGLSEPEEVFALRGPGLDEPGTLAVVATRFGQKRPQPITRLIGRHEDLDRLIDLVVEGRLVTIVGPGGVGKSRLALELLPAVDDKFPDGVVWIELAPLVTGTAVTQAVADVLGVRAQPGSDLGDLVVNALTGRRVLLAFDNAEHVRGELVVLVAALLGRCADVSIAVTSRERLGVPGERLLILDALAHGGPDSPAVNLLAERLADGGERLLGGGEPDAADLVAIAQRLDGLPLALELAAARCRTLGVSTVADRLRNELGGLADRYRVEPRHRTLEAMLAWSYELLDDDEQRTLCQAAVFAGGFTIDGLCEVVDLPAGVVDEALASLVDKSLVQRRAGRFQLLATTRAFALERLAAGGDVSTALDRHRDHVLHVIAVCTAGLRTRDERRWVDTLDADWADVRAAVRRMLDGSDAVAVAALVGPLAYEAFWRRSEALAWMIEACDRFGDVATPRQHELLAAGCLASWVLLDIDRAVVLGERALALQPALAATAGLIPEAAALGAYNYAGRPADAVDLCRRTLRAADAEDRWGRAYMYGNLALSAGLTGDTDAGIEAGRTGFELAERVGNPTLVAYTAFAAGTAHAFAGDADGGSEYLALARNVGATVDNSWILSMTSLSTNWGDPRLAPQEGLARALDAVDELQRTGWTTHAWTGAWFLVHWLLVVGDTEAAAYVCGACATSGVQPMFFTVPPPLDVLPDSGDARLRARYQQGQERTLPEVISVSSGGALPLLP